VAGLSNKRVEAYGGFYYSAGFHHYGWTIKIVEYMSAVFKKLSAL
jgi:hypothetical protein